MSLITDVFQKLETAKSVVTYMAKNSPVRKLTESQHAKESKTLLKSERK